jgi:hypothetical protein
MVTALSKNLIRKAAADAPDRSEDGATVKSVEQVDIGVSEPTTLDGQGAPEAEAVRRAEEEVALLRRTFVKPKVPADGSEVSFPIRRVRRLLAPYAVSLLTGLSHQLSRAALDVDLAKGTVD